MPDRKFFHGDIVRFRQHTNGGVVLGRYKSHHDHMATIIKTTIIGGDKWHRVLYSVACECGRQVRPQAGHLDLVARQYDRRDLATQPEELRRLRFYGDYEAKIKRYMETLPEREKIILIRRHGLDGSFNATLSAVGKELGISREWVRQIELRAIRKMSRAMGGGGDEV